MNTFSGVCMLDKNCVTKFIRKEFYANGIFNTKAELAWLYLRIKESRWALISVEESVKLFRVDIDFYVDISEESLLNSAKLTRWGESKKFKQR